MFYMPCCLLLIIALPSHSVIDLNSTLKSCLETNVKITDDNYEDALSYYKACKELALKKKPFQKLYIKSLSAKLKRANENFLRKTLIPIRKLCKIEKEVNEIYEELVEYEKSAHKSLKDSLDDESIEMFEDESDMMEETTETGIIKKEKQQQGCCCDQHMKTSKYPRTKKTTCISEKQKGIKNFSFGKPSFLSDNVELNFTILLLVICGVTLVLCLFTCCYVIRIYSRLYLFTAYDDELQSISSASQYRGKHGSTVERRSR